MHINPIHPNILQEYLLQDRQWPHHLRVGHAKMQLANATTDDDRAFWKAVLKANATGASDAR